MRIQVLLHKIDTKEKGFSNFVNKCIGFFTVSKYWHVSIVLGNYRYESGHPRGVSKTTSIPTHKFITNKYIEVTDEQLAKMIAYAEKTLTDNIRYNYYKLFILALFHPTQFIWNKLKWMPFSNNFFGMVCSVYVREIFLAGGIDILPWQYKEITAPGDFLKTGLLE